MHGRRTPPRVKTRPSRPQFPFSVSWALSVVFCSASRLSSSTEKTKEERWLNRAHSNLTSLGGHIDEHLSGSPYPEINSSLLAPDYDVLSISSPKDHTFLICHCFCTRAPMPLAHCFSFALWHSRTLRHPRSGGTTPLSTSTHQRRCDRRGVQGMQARGTPW